MARLEGDIENLRKLRQLLEKDNRVSRKELDTIRYRYLNLALHTGVLKNLKNMKEKNIFGTDPFLFLKLLIEKKGETATYDEFQVEFGKKEQRGFNVDDVKAKKRDLKRVFDELGFPKDFLDEFVGSGKGYYIKDWGDVDVL